MIKKQDISDNFVYVSSKDFTFALDDEKSRQFGVLFEITDMLDATGEKEFEGYPFIVSVSIIADKCHKSFNQGDVKPSKLSLLLDCNSYMGGVPIDHTLTDSVGGSKELGMGGAFEKLSSQFNSSEATVKTSKSNFGTVAAQRGPVEYSYLQFKNEAAARKFIDYLIANRVSALSVIVGFILDRPINMAGDSGWSVITNHVFGCK